MDVRVGHSPDPDDAFMYWALTTDLVDKRGFRFEQVPADIETLNQWARAARLEVTAISLATYPFVQQDYALLPHGASIGAGYGPVVVARAPMGLDDLKTTEIAVPGRMTTAFLTLRLVLGDFAYREVPFEQIPDEVASGRAQAGLLIHEGQLTFDELGLMKVVDLGEWWLLETGLPLPLGVNVARRDIDRLGDLSGVLREAIATVGLRDAAATNTTLAVVAVNASFDRVALEQLARAASAAFLRRITPAGTTYDGDVVFAICPVCVTKSSAARATRPASPTASRPAAVTARRRANRL